MKDQTCHCDCHRGGKVLHSIECCAQAGKQLPQQTLKADPLAFDTVKKTK